MSLLKNVKDIKPCVDNYGNFIIDPLDMTYGDGRSNIEHQKGYQHYLGIDDYGNNIYYCHYTQEPLSLNEIEWVGTFIKIGYPIKIPIKNTKDVKQMYRNSRINFDIHDANCNTCKFLDRIKKSDTAGFMYGKCSNINGDIKLIPYKSEEENVIVFHPNDAMNMKCYQHRNS